MNRNIIKLAALPSVFGIVALATSLKETENNVSSTEGLELFYTVPHADEVEVNESVANVAATGNSFTGFKQALGFKESQNDYSKINKYGYLGKYQFGRSTLRLLGVTDTDEFLNNPILQERTFLANAKRNKWVLRRDIKRYTGRTINGVKITESGILAAAHLAGPGSVKRYLRSGGVEGFRDAFGTSIRSYLKKFAGYDVSFIEADRNAKVNIEGLALND
ncbi:MAG: peptidoglycan-binding protein LysM [Cytophagaceae bacterium]|nr:peptidoglycan-binding protein LysM [Cytophagaceae bacterium]